MASSLALWDLARWALAHLGEVGGEGKPVEGGQVGIRGPTQGDGQVTIAAPNLLLLGAEADAKQVGIPGLPAVDDGVVADQENLHRL